MIIIFLIIIFFYYNYLCLLYSYNMYFYAIFLETITIVFYKNKLIA